MEEILASIRRIISEDGATVEPAPPPSDTVLDLTEILQTEQSVAPPPPPPMPVETVPELVMEDNMPDPTPPPAPAETAQITPDKDRLISELTAQATAVAMGTLAPSRSGSADPLPLGNGGRTVESMVMDMLRPLLKDWLDRNLPTLVERIVQKEIRKITRDLG